MKITFFSRGSFDRTDQMLAALKQLKIDRIVESQAKRGVEALSHATPQDSGLAARSWSYEISKSKKGMSIFWTNSDMENGFPVAVMIQYGHGTGTGGYVDGIDYINPAIRPIFDQIADTVWKAVTSA